MPTVNLLHFGDFGCLVPIDQLETGKPILFRLDPGADCAKGHTSALAYLA